LGQPTGKCATLGGVDARFLPTSCRKLKYRNKALREALKGERPMADRFSELKAKYQSVMNFIQQQQNTQLQNVNMEGDKLLIRASAPSQEVKNKIWDQIKLVDPSFSDLIADIQAPASAAAAAAAAGGPTSGARTYTVKPGDSLTKISQEFYGHANQYMKIFEANKDKLADPDKVRAGMQLVIP
jgi:LysM repeat protein